MKSQLVKTFAIGAAAALCASAQVYQRPATMVGGNPDRGKCTIEVLVDDVAQVEVRGSTATIRTMSGQPAQLRRFECSAPLPPNPANFKFQGIDGRGRQTLVRDPRNGGAAVVEIEDKDSGAEGYTFDIMWDARASGGGYAPGPSGNQPGYRDRNDQTRPGESDRYRNSADDQYRPNYRDSDYYHRYNHGFSASEAVRVCQDEVQRQASRRFRDTDIHFYRTNIDDGQGRQDWVVGAIDVHRGRRLETYNFSCAVDFDGGRIRSAQIDDRPSRTDNY